MWFKYWDLMGVRLFRWECFIVKKGQHSLLRNQDFNDFVSVSLSKVCIAFLFDFLKQLQRFTYIQKSCSLFCALRFKLKHPQHKF